MARLKLRFIKILLQSVLISAEPGNIQHFLLTVSCTTFKGKEVKSSHCPFSYLICIPMVRLLVSPPSYVIKFVLFQKQSILAVTTLFVIPLLPSSNKLFPIALARLCGVLSSPKQAYQIRQQTYVLEAQSIVLLLR